MDVTKKHVPLHVFLMELGPPLLFHSAIILLSHHAPLSVRIWFHDNLSILVFAKRLSWSPKATDVSTTLVHTSQWSCHGLISFQFIALIMTIWLYQKMLLSYSLAYNIYILVHKLKTIYLRAPAAYNSLLCTRTSELTAQY
jgi:hypothetical protein